MASENNSHVQQKAVAKPGVIPTIISPDGKKHIEWLKTVLGAEVKQTLYRDEKEETVMHCDMAVNGGALYLADRCWSEKVEGDGEPGGFLCHLCVEDPNVIWSKAMSNGCTAVNELKVQSWGSLYGSFKDPFGFDWSVAKRGDSPEPGVVPYLLTPNGECEKHIDWLKTVFKAEVTAMYRTDDDKIMHCDLAVNGSHVYLSDGQQSGGKSPCGLTVHMDFPDPKETWQTALDNSATVKLELKRQFWGDVFGIFKDSFGFSWSVMEAEKPSEDPRKGVVPQLFTSDCEKHVEWIKNVLGGELREIYRTPDKTKVMHCVMAVNGGFVNLADVDAPTTPEQVKHAEGEPRGFSLHQEVPDPSIIWKKAMRNDAIIVVDLKVQSWGGMFGCFRDPFGFSWGLMRSGPN